MKKNKAFDISDYKICENCSLATKIIHSDLVICKKRGIVDAFGSCKHFTIDLLAVRPKKLRTIKSNLSEEDFTL